MLFFSDVAGKASLIGTRGARSYFVQSYYVRRHATLEETIIPSSTVSNGYSKLLHVKTVKNPLRFDSIRYWYLLSLR